MKQKFSFSRWSAALAAALSLATGLHGQIAIGFGETKTSQQLTVPSQQTVFSFAGTVGQEISIQMSYTSGGTYFTPTFDLISPGGFLLKTVMSPDLRQTARLSLFSLPATGTYFIVCRDDDGLSTGTYNLTLISHSGSNLRIPMKAYTYSDPNRTPAR